MKVEHYHSDICQSFLKKLYDPHNEDAWEKFNEIYKGFIYHHIIKMVHDKDQFDDIYQELSIHVWRKIVNYKPELTNFLSWLSHVIKNKIIDILRKLSREFKNNHMDITQLDLVDEAIESLNKSEWNRHIINESLSRLKKKSSKLRYTYIKMYLDGHSTEDICAVLNINRSNSYKIKQRVQAQLRKEILDLIDA